MMDDQRQTRTITIPEDGLYRIEAGEVTRIYQQTGAAVHVEAGDRTYVIPDGTWTVIEFDTEDL